LHYLTRPANQVVNRHLDFKSKQNALIHVINVMDHCEWFSFRLPNDHTLFADQCILVIFQVTLDGAACVQEFSKSRPLGRAYLRSSGRTIAVSVINLITGQDQNYKTHTLLQSEQNPCCSYDYTLCTRPWQHDT
jgi:hypothetical protein